MYKQTNFHKLLLYSLPQVFKHSFAKLIQVFQIWFSTYNTSPLTCVTVTKISKENTLTTFLIFWDVVIYEYYTESNNNNMQV